MEADNMIAIGKAVKVKRGSTPRGDDFPAGAVGYVVSRGYNNTGWIVFLLGNQGSHTLEDDEIETATGNDLFLHSFPAEVRQNVRALLDRIHDLESALLDSTLILENDVLTNSKAETRAAANRKLFNGTNAQ